MYKFKNNELASYFLTHWKFSFNLTIWALRLESFVTIESLHDAELATAGKIKPRAAGVLFSGKAWEMSNKEEEEEEVVVLELELRWSV